MPFRDPSGSLRDIADAIAMIEDFTRDLDFESFCATPMAVAAVERKLQVISEAATRLGENAERLSTGLPWRNIRGLGNWLRHQYDRIELPMIWKTVKDDLPPLKIAVRHALQSPSSVHQPPRPG
ncbi:MAG: HepT-like ribonuclease domain-containing protein [Acidobacteriota bacterium]